MAIERELVGGEIARLAHADDMIFCNRIFSISLAKIEKKDKRRKRGENGHSISHKTDAR